MFDPTTITLNGITLIAVVFGLVEFIKSQFEGLTGKRVTALSAVTGAVIYGLYSVIPLIPAPYSQYVVMGFTSVVFGLTASGFYKFTAARLPSSVK